MKAVRVHKAGGPEGLVYEDVPDPKAGAGQAVVKVEAIGLNFAEVNRRRDAAPASLPMPIGGEAAGTVVEVGDRCHGVQNWGSRRFQRRPWRLCRNSRGSSGAPRAHP